MLEVGVPGSMIEGQMEGSGVFRAGSTACLASKSCLAKNNVKTRLPPGCLTRLEAGPRLGGSPTQRASGVSTFPKQLGPEDPEGGGFRRGHCCTSGSQKWVEDQQPKITWELVRNAHPQSPHQAWCTSPGLPRGGSKQLVF